MTDQPDSGGYGLLDHVAALVGDALTAAPDDGSRAALREVQQRLREPLRVAIAGKVKAGKSTLLNALVGEEVAPTDAGECTKVVTWYGNGVTYLVTLHARDGSTRQVPFRRRNGALEVQLGGTALDDIDHLEVTWPSQRLSRVTLIDTPGIGSISADVSARTYEFLDGEDSPGAADAVLYLLRHLHATDARFLEAFHDEELASGTPINTLGVLSRADEIGACRPTAMEAAGRVAARYRADATIRRLCQTVIPVAGLLAQAGATLREEEFEHLSAIARLAAEDRVGLLLTVDRFGDESAPTTVPAPVRAALLDRFGLYGVRLGTELIALRQVRSSSELAARFQRTSGIDALHAALSDRLGARTRVLKARTALAGLNRVLVGARGPAVDQLLGRAEQIQSGAHEIAEVRLLNDLWLQQVELPAERAEDLEQLLGGRGTTIAERLGLPAAAGLPELWAAAGGARQTWSRLAEYPLSPTSVKAAARVACRTCEGILMALPQPGSAANGAPPGPRGPR